MEGSESFLNLSGNGAVCYDNGGCQPPWWPAQSLSVFKNKPNVSVAFFLLHFFLFQATDLLGGSCSKWLIHKIRVYE